MMFDRITFDPDVTHNPQVAAAARREITLRDGRITKDLSRVEARV